MVIVFKKGYKQDLNNYRPTCLLSNVYQILTKVLTKRLEKTLDKNQPREQAGFRSRYSTTDHIYVVKQLKEKCGEYNIPFDIALVNYETAFGSVHTQALLTSLQEQGIEDPEGNLHQQLDDTPPIQRKQKINIRKGVRQTVYVSIRKDIPTTDLGKKA